MLLPLITRRLASFLLPAPARLLLVGLLWLLTPAAHAADQGGPGPGVRRAVAAVLDVRGLEPGTLVRLATERGGVVVNVRASSSSAHLPFAGLPAGRYTVYTDAPGAPALLVTFDGRRITGTSDVPTPADSALAVDAATGGR